MYQNHYTIMELQRFLQEETTEESRCNPLIYSHLEECDYCKSKLKKAMLLNAMQEDEFLQSAITLCKQEAVLHRERLAARLVLQQGKNCGKKRIEAILKGNYIKQSVDGSSLSKQAFLSEAYTIRMENNKLVVEVPCEKTMEADVIVDCKQGNGTLLVKTAAWNHEKKAAIAEFADLQGEAFDLFVNIRAIQEAEAVVTATEDEVEDL